jgi:uncharacterized protein involved in outer membrane biogenesis
VKKVTKIVLISLAVVVVLVIVAVGIVVLSLGSIVRTGVEKGGSYALKVPVKLEGASVSVLKGRASLTGFSVANPQGYASGLALAFGEITAEVKPFSLGKDPVEIPEIVVSKPAVSIEGTLTGDTNVGQLLKNLEATLGGSGGSKPKPTEKPGEKPPQKPAEPAAAKRLKLDHLLLENPQVTVAAQLMGQTQKKSVTLGRVEFKDLAKEYPQGLTAAELGKKVLDELLRQALKDKGEIGAALQKLMDKGALGTVKSITDDATKLGKEALTDPTKAQEIIKDPKKATEGLKDVKDVKDLFNKKK